MSDPPRVLILNQRDSRHPRAGGAEVHIEEIFSRLVDRGWSVTQAASAFRGASGREVVAGLHVRRLGRLASYYPRAAWTCARETRRERFDVVVECLNKLPFYSPAYSAVPVVVIAHHLFGETAFLQAPWPIAAAVWSLERPLPLLYRNVPFVAISESTRDDLVRRGIRANRVRVVHCGSERPDVELAPIADRPRRVAYVGRLEPYKRVDVLLHAMSRLADRFPDSEIVVIGRGADRARLERVAREVGLARRTRFTGFVTRGERDRLLASCRASVCPSPKEGWGLTVIESNAAGTPVVATDAPGLRDSVDDGKTGFLVGEADVDAFADRLTRLLSDDVLATEMSAAALAWTQRFDWDRAADAMAESLQAALEAR
jgi:glycosyltransferase involved in cell wall biosynthesis